MTCMPSQDCHSRAAAQRRSAAEIYEMAIACIWISALHNAAICGDGIFGDFLEAAIKYRLIPLTDS